MKIAIDLRSLSSGRISGVENYGLNLLENLPVVDRQNSYIFFYNALKRAGLPDFHYVNSEVRQTRYPSKLLNLALKLGLVKMEKLLGELDWFFMPNLNQFSINNQTKLAITVHDLSPLVTPEFYDLKRKIWHKFLNYKQAFERADILFAVSEYTKKDLIRILNISEGKIKVVYPGLDLKIFKPDIPEPELRAARNLYGLPGSYILFLNTIEPRKNLAAAVKAFEQLKGDEHLVIAGRLGWKYEPDFALIGKSRKNAKIKYIGYVAEKHKPALIKMAGALVYPSFYEGFGFQCLEAMAVGTPVIASSIAALPEVLGNSGLLINPYDIGSLAEGLESIISNPNLRENLRQKGFERAKQFSWQETSLRIAHHLTFTK